LGELNDFYLYDDNIEDIAIRVCNAFENGEYTIVETYSIWLQMDHECWPVKEFM